MNKETNWYDYDDGYSIGTTGSDGGLILRDEEHASGEARMTLEEDGSFAPFSITCGIYGWLVHTRFFSEESEANEEFDRMKSDLDEILQSLQAADRQDAIDEISEEISEFVKKFP